MRYAGQFINKAKGSAESNIAPTPIIVPSKAGPVLYMSSTGRTRTNVNKRNNEPTNTCFAQ